MKERRKKASVPQNIKHKLFDFFNSAKNLKTYQNELNNNFNIHSSAREEKGKRSDKTMIQSKEITKKPMRVDDRPSPEKISKENASIIKKIIFRKLDIKNNEKEIIKLILDNQNRANEVNKLKDFKSFFFVTQKKFYHYVMDLKENIAYYSLIFRLYINSSQKNKAKELFLLMDKQNKELIQLLSNAIKKAFRLMQNNNRIGKYSPLIIKFFFQIVSVMIKLSSICNKPFIENFYLKIYMETMLSIRETITDKFTSINNELENDYKLMSRFFYYDCAYKMSIYFLYRYQAFNIVISLLQFINEQYHKKDVLYLINSENLLLLKLHYNLALIYYVDGNNKEAITNLNQAKGRIYEITSFPYTIIKENNNNIIKSKPRISVKNKNSNDVSNNNKCPDRSSITSFNIDETVENYVTGNRVKKRSISSRLSGDLTITEKNFEPRITFCSNLVYGKEKYTDKEQTRYINDCLSQKMEIEIELLMAEIELDQKHYKESFTHVNKILNTIKQPTKKYTKEKSFPAKKMYNYEHDSALTNRTYLKLADLNKFSYSNNNVVFDSFNLSKIQYSQPISESNRRYISYILEVIEQEYKNRSEYMTSYNDTNNINLSDYKKNSKTDRMEYNKRYNQNKNRERIISLETEKFFIFICGLSIYQLKILNEFQPEPSKMRDDLPILFPNQFKDCLTFSQRLALNNLDTMSLSRYIILKDSNKDISPENLDYVFLTKKIKSSHKDKNYDCITSRDINNQNFFDIKRQLSKSSCTNSPESSGESTGSKKGFETERILKKNLFDKERLQKFVEDDKIFNQKIDEITKNDNKHFLEINRIKILKVLHSLQPNEKQLLMNSSSHFKKFLKKIEKKMLKKHNKEEV